MTDLKPGMEMDSTVAKALGWTEVAVPGKAPYWIRGKEVMTLLRCYSKTDTGAFTALDDVLARMPAGYGWELVAEVNQYECAIDDENLVTLGMGRGTTRAEAICRAILALEAA